MVLLHSKRTQNIVQVLTSAKALVLALSVFSVLVLSTQSNIVDGTQVVNWKGIGSGWLMGTVALGEAEQVFQILIHIF